MLNYTHPTKISSSESQKSNIYLRILGQTGGKKKVLDGTRQTLLGDTEAHACPGRGCLLWYALPVMHYILNTFARAFAWNLPVCLISMRT